MNNYRKMVNRVVKDTMREFGYKTNKVAVEIKGEVQYMTEPEIRALQVIAKRTYEESEARFNDFCKDVIVYSGRYKSKSKHQMHFCKDGYFDEEFEPGFYSVNTNLSHELL